MASVYIDPYPRVGQVLKFKALGKRYYELLFNRVGVPIAFRIRLTVEHLGYDWVLHYYSGAELPKNWLEKSKAEAHDERAFNDKVESFLRAATQL